MVGGASSRNARTVEAEGRKRAERTLNMYPMSVTLDVSKLSGWLNTDAYCRVEGGYMGGGVTCGQAGGSMGQGGRWRKQQECPDCGGRGQGTRGAHLKHVPHVCDAGRVEAQRLVERRSPLPSNKRKHRRRRNDMWARRREGKEGW